jgi:CheY-like chemotaxis protein
MAFRAKRIFLAEDEPKEREKIRNALVEAGHTIVVEAENGVQALSLVDDAVAKGVEVAVLDGYMPNPRDGQKVAAELSARLPELIITSISSMPLGVWKDPHFDSTKPYHEELKSCDVNGREQYRGPDISARQFDWDLKKFAHMIGETEFSLRDERSLAQLPSMLEFIQSTRNGERK